MGLWNANIVIFYRWHVLSNFMLNSPPQFWGECLLTAVHIINRLPSPVLSFKTPFELLYSKSPSYSHLRVFGCLAYATNIHTSHKFDHYAVPSVFIGYPIGQKTYKLFDLSSKKVFTSRDVRFHEHIFPYAFVQPISNTSPSAHSPGPIPLLTPDSIFLTHSAFDPIPPESSPPPLDHTVPPSHPTQTTIVPITSSPPSPIPVPSPENPILKMSHSAIPVATPLRR